MTDTIPYSDLVCTELPWNSTIDTDEISEIPLHVVLLAEMEKIENNNQLFERIISKGLQVYIGR